MVAVQARLPWLVLIGLVTTTFAAPERKPAITLTSESAWEAFGSELGADRDLLVFKDRPTTGGSVSRVVRVANGRVAEESRLVHEGYSTAVDVSGNRIAVRFVTPTLEIYERALTGWAKVQTLELTERCHGVSLDLAGDVLIADGDDIVCVYERRRDWTFVRHLPPGNVESVTNGDRIAQVIDSPGAVRLWRRRGGRWEVEREIQLGGDRHPHSIAISSKWLAVGTHATGMNNDEVEIYALAARVNRTSVLKGPNLGNQVTVSDDRLVVDGIDARVFRFDGTWREVSSLPKATSLLARIAIGDLMWTGLGGTIHGYAD